MKSDSPSVSQAGARNRTGTRLRLAIALAALTAATATAVAQPRTPTDATPGSPATRGQAVLVPSLDRHASGEPIELPARWFTAGRASADVATHAAAPPPPTVAPALVLLHGCGGMYAASARRPGATPVLSARMQELAAEFTAAGVNVLVLDSLTPRGEVELCTQKTGTRRVTQQERRRDALSALAWLALQPEVDARRLGLVGWSNGGSTVLAATNRRHPEVRQAAVQPSLAVSFYPGCDADEARGYEPSAPLLMLLGADDDWTPPGPCEALVAATAARGLASVMPELVIYPGAHHGFDSRAPVRHRVDVPNGLRPGAGVHVGGHPIAREQSRLRLQQFLQQHWP